MKIKKTTDWMKVLQAANTALLTVLAIILVQIFDRTWPILLNFQTIRQVVVALAGPIVIVSVLNLIKLVVVAKDGVRPTTLTVWGLSSVTTLLLTLLIPENWKTAAVTFIQDGQLIKVAVMSTADIFTVSLILWVGLTMVLSILYLREE